MTDIVLDKLERNDRVKCIEAVRLITKIVDNVIDKPYDVKLRTLKKNNVTIKEKILSIEGGLDCLRLLGFRENGNEEVLVLPKDVPLERLRNIKETVLNVVFNRPQTSTKVKEEDQEEIVRPVILPTLEQIYSNAFLREMESLFHNALIYKDRNLLARARKLVPSTVHERATIRFRDLQITLKKMKKSNKGQVVVGSDKDEEEEVSLKDMELLELMDWFKNDFFSWVDSPDCEQCGSKTKFSHMCEDVNLMLYTDRVEMHECTRCKALTPFARYNDPNILLETRRGRCGEWANVFTLFCCSFDWDTRIVYCQTDHVWTEVYSEGRKRWLHCDPCENVCDNPLMYENGWNKRLTYVIAYGTDELQDVTWRYTSDHKTTLKRRTKCREIELTDAVVDLNARRQATFSDARRSFLTKRRLNELVEFLTERKPTKDSEKGRTSGSLDWRLARNETNTSIKSHRVFLVDDETFGDVNVPLLIRYNPITNVYEEIMDDRVIRVSDGWESMVYENEAIFRKVEKDWQMVYLCRNENAIDGQISWFVKLAENTKKQIRNVEVSFQYVTFEDGLVDVDVVLNENDVKKLDQSTKTLQLNDLKSCKSIKIVARLSGGNGSVRWQHAQLFRQKMTDVSIYPFVVRLNFI